jgi:hypothetical protein
VVAHTLTLAVLEGRFAVCRLPADAPAPAWAAAGPFVSLTRTAAELSVVCLQDAVPEGVRGERGWRCLCVAGPLDFSLAGVLASVVGPLADAGIAVFAVSTFDTDYLLVNAEGLGRAIEVLRRAGHTIEQP